MHVVSTAGHVDHGKSTLIERLTGIDPDRLAEEKARGLTIDLGFAWMRLPSGREIGIVDVPGHERFIHNMLAGVGSVDATIFVVAANEGWKPQSEEHLAILDLLGARRGIIALTKSDLVDDDALDQVRAQVRARLAGTTLDGAPIIPVSSATGAGLDEVRAALDGLLDAEPHDAGRPRLFVDRSFSIKGAGTVVTGTLTGGTLRVEDMVEVLPAGARARIRSIQSHKQQREAAHPVSRVALNLVGIERTDIARGDAIVLSGQWRATRVLDVEVRVVRDLDHALSNRGAFTAHVGSTEVTARLSLYDAAEVKPGERAFARLHLARDVVAAPADRIVLRDAGRQKTVAGGAILDAHPPDARTGARTDHLARRADASRDTMPSIVVAERGVVARADLPWLAGSQLVPADAIPLGDYLVSRGAFERLARALKNTLRAFHEREPLAQGMPREDARIAAAVTDPRLFAALVDALDGTLVAAEGASLRHASHRVALNAEQEQARMALVAELHAAGFSPPPLKDLRARYGDTFVRAQIETRTLIRITDDLAYAKDTLEAAKNVIETTIRSDGPSTASRLKDALGTTRKYAIPLLEYFDNAGVTKRTGENRVLPLPDELRDRFDLDRRA